MRRRVFRAELIVTVVAIAGMILFNASYGESIVSWGGGTATGVTSEALDAGIASLTGEILQVEYGVFA